MLFRGNDNNVPGLSGLAIRQKKGLALAFVALLTLSLLSIRAGNGQTSCLLLPPSTSDTDTAKGYGYIYSANASEEKQSVSASLLLLPANFTISNGSRENDARVAVADAVPFFDLVPPDQIEFCEANNFVHMSHTELPFRRPETAKPYSITKYSFQRYHNQYCSDSTQLLNAIRLGKRVWPSENDGNVYQDNHDDSDRDDPVAANQSSTNETMLLTLYSNFNMTLREQIPSYFRPHGCDIPYMKQREFCNAANLFSEIVIQGDSLSRHISKAMLMIYRNNFILGGAQPPFNDHVLETLHRCLCDSQFSSSMLCRDDCKGILMQYKPSHLHLCPEVPFDGQFTQNFAINRPRKVFQFQGNCSDPNHKGILLVLQGGVHYKYKARDTWRNLFRQILKQPRFLECARLGKLIWIWTGYTSQSPSLDGTFPHQDMQRGLDFNREIKALMQQSKLTIPFVDWIGLTYGSQRPDGLHFLSDVNVERAQHVMALAKMLREEKKFQTVRT